jgi:hypothetical protein
MTYSHHFLESSDLRELNRKLFLIGGNQFPFLLIDPNFDPLTESPRSAFPPSFFQSGDLSPNDC